MHLVRLVYVSTVLADLDLNELSKLAQTNNLKHNLSGLLAFDRKYFIQVVEGGRTAVSGLLANLFSDPRHKDVVILEFDYVDKRDFGQWSMQFVPLDTSMKQTIFKHSVGKTFDPYGFTKNSALSFLMDMRPAVIGN
jgi:hypothetical protein